MLNWSLQPISQEKSKLFAVSYSYIYNIRVKPAGKNQSADEEEKGEKGKLKRGKIREKKSCLNWFLQPISQE